MPDQQDHPPHIHALYRYPIKGLSPERLNEALMEPGEVIAGDRAYALENGSADFDPHAPRYFPKTKFLMLMKHERLARLRTQFDPDSHVLKVTTMGEDALEANLSTKEGRQALESFIQKFMPGDLRGAPRIVYGQGHSFSDVAMKCVSIINLASVRDLEQKAKQKLHPLRFRANIYLEGLEPWVEMEWLDKLLKIGQVTLTIEKTTIRCPATQVNPDTAERDSDVPRLLRDLYGHQILGVYARIASGGTITQGDAVTPPC